jgi:hypothetical protein
MGGIALLLLTVASVQPARAQQLSGFPRTVVIDSIEYRAEIERVKAGMEVTKGRHPFRARVDGYMVYLIATNLSNRPVRREVAGDCLLSLGLHPVGRGRMRPVYDPHGGCDFDVVLLQLEPGESKRRWDQGIFPRFIRIPRDSLPNGEYIVTARVRPTDVWERAPREIYVARIQLVRPKPPRPRRPG